MPRTNSRVPSCSILFNIDRSWGCIGATSLGRGWTGSFQLVLMGRLLGVAVWREERRLSGRAAFLTEKRAGRDDPPGESYIELSICAPQGTRTFFTASLVRGQ